MICQDLWRLHASKQKLLYMPELQEVLGEKATSPLNLHEWFKMCNQNIPVAPGPAMPRAAWR